MEFKKWDLVPWILSAVAPILVCVGLIVLQPDLGTSVDILLIMTAILFVAGLSWKWLAVGAAAALPVVIALVAFVSYRRARITAFLHSGSSPAAAVLPLTLFPHPSAP